MVEQKELPARLFIRVGAEWKPACCKPFPHPCDGIREDLFESGGLVTIYRLYNLQCYSRTSTGFIMSRGKFAVCSANWLEFLNVSSLCVQQLLSACTQWNRPNVHSDPTCRSLPTFAHMGGKKKHSLQVQLLCWSLVFWALLQANSCIDVLFNNTSMSTGTSLQAQETFPLVPLWPVCSRSCRVTPAPFKHAETRRENWLRVYLIPFWLWLKALAHIGLDVLPA